MQTFYVKPICTINLNHPATRLSSTPDAKQIVIGSDAPKLSVGGFDHPSIQSIEIARPARHIAISLDGEMLAVVDASYTLRLLTLRFNTFGEELARCDDRVHDVCEFSRDGTMLWSVGLIDNDVAEIRCYDFPTLKVISKHRFQLPIGQCGFMLTPHPREDLLGLWVCGGPDEAWNYWIDIAGNSIELRHQPELDGATPPRFNSRGDRFVVLNGYDLVAFSFPDCRMLFEPVSAEDEDDVWAESMTYLNSPTDDHVLTSTNEARLLIVGLEQGEIVGEVHLERHEPRPAYEIYQSLPKSENHLCTDLHWFMAVGSDLIVSIHTNGKASDRRDSVLCWNKPSL